MKSWISWINQNRITWWEKLSAIGIHHLTTEDEISRSRLLNQIIFIALLFNLLYVPLCWVTGKTALIPSQLFFSILVTLLFLLNNKGKFELATYSLYLIFILNISITSLLIQDVGTKLMLIPAGISTLAIFRKTRLAIVVFSITLLTYGIIEYLNDIIIPVVLVGATTAAFNAMFNVVIIITISFLIVYYFRNSNVSYQKVLVDQRDIIKEKNEEIVDSITYAKRIQTAILPPVTMLKKHLPESYVWYHPKEIVAGDFFWIEEQGEAVFFAVADSTGHGVSAAMVSIVCYQALNRSVRELGLSQPGKVLDKARTLVMETFGDGKDDLHDGMDITLCKLNKVSNTLEFAGANNGLRLIRKGEVQEIEGNQQHIGKLDDPQPFLNHVIELQKEDVIYIFSDGFKQQFEAGKTKKYTSLNAFLLAIQGKSMEEQKLQIKTAFTTWLGGQNQLDDVCLLAVKI